MSASASLHLIIRLRNSLWRIVFVLWRAVLRQGFRKPTPLFIAPLSQQIISNLGSWHALIYTHHLEYSSLSTPLGRLCNIDQRNHLVLWSSVLIALWIFKCHLGSSILDSFSLPSLGHLNYYREYPWNLLDIPNWEISSALEPRRRYVTAIPFA